MSKDREASTKKGVPRQEHRARAIWAADCAERVLPLFERDVPGDDRPRRAIEAARAWARGEVRVSEARTAALAAHAAARDAARSAAACTPAGRAGCAAARAAGHAAATAHVITHARAVQFYADKAVSAAEGQKRPRTKRSE